MSAQIRLADTDQDRAAAFRLRYELYVEDQGLFLESDEADHERRLLSDEYDVAAPIWIAELDGEVVGTMRVIWGALTPFCTVTREACETKRFHGLVSQHDMLVFSRLVVHPDQRGKGLALRLIRRCYEFAVQNGVELIFGNCEAHLVRPWSRLGFRSYGKRYEHPTNGPLVRVVSLTGDLEYHRRIGSPMLDIARQRSRPGVAVASLLARLKGASSWPGPTVDRYPGFAASLRRAAGSPRAMRAIGE